MKSKNIKNNLKTISKVGTNKLGVLKKVGTALLSAGIMVSSISVCYLLTQPVCRAIDFKKMLEKNCTGSDDVIYVMNLIRDQEFYKKIVAYKNEWIQSMKSYRDNINNAYTQRNNAKISYDRIYTIKNDEMLKLKQSHFCDIIVHSELYNLKNKLVNDTNNYISKLSNIKYLSNDIGIPTASFTLDKNSILELKKCIENLENKFYEIESKIFYLAREYYKISIEIIKSNYEYIQVICDYNNIISDYYKSDLYSNVIDYTLRTVYEDTEIGFGPFREDLCQNCFTQLDFMIFLLETNETIQKQ